MTVKLQYATFPAASLNLYDTDVLPMGNRALLPGVEVITSVTPTLSVALTSIHETSTFVAEADSVTMVMLAVGQLVTTGSSVS